MAAASVPSGTATRRWERCLERSVAERVCSGFEAGWRVSRSPFENVWVSGRGVGEARL